MIEPQPMHCCRRKPATERVQLRARNHVKHANERSVFRRGGHQLAVERHCNGANRVLVRSNGGWRARGAVADVDDVELAQLAVRDG